MSARTRESRPLHKLLAKGGLYGCGRAGEMAFVLDGEVCLCVVCRKPIPQYRIAEGAFTCGENVCHEAFVTRLERQFGTHKRVIDMKRRKVFLVPVRDMVERTVKQQDLWQYPSVEPTREEAIGFEAAMLRSIGLRPEERDGVHGLVLDDLFFPVRRPDPSEMAVVICRRVKKPQQKPMPGCIVRKCATCDEDVWISPSSQVLLEERPDTRIVCNQCAEKELEAEAREKKADKENGDGGKAAGTGFD